MLPPNVSTSALAPPAGGSLPGLHDFRPPSREEIDAVVAPFVLRRMPASSREWQEIVGRIGRTQRRNSLKRRIKNLFPGFGHARPQSLVSNYYEVHWSAAAWPQTTASARTGDRGVPCLWGDEGMILRRYGTKRAHQLMFARLVAALRPRTALEVGSGTGINLLVMSALFPDIAWTGVELTEAGVAMTRSVQQEAELPQVLRDFAPMPVVDPTAHRAVAVRQGDATALPFPDRSFDLVFTFLAVEQMQAVRDRAMSEIARVARGHVALTEPLNDFNRSPIQRAYKQARGYLDMSVADLPSFGLRPVMVNGDFPQKVTLGAGLALCEAGR